MERFEGNAHEKAMHVEKSAHSEPIHSLDVSKDGKYLATCSSDKTIVVWKTRRMKASYVLRAYGYSDGCLVLAKR